MKYKVVVDAVYPEETRVAVLSDKNNKIIDYDFESSYKKQLKGNIYLAKVSRVEPSLQAAFIEYEKGKHGFLPFSEIHPDYYQVPVADRKKLLALVNQETNHEQENLEKAESNAKSNTSKEEDSDNAKTNCAFYHNYQIQEVVKVGQLMLVQVVKEARGNKGVTLTTYVALVGRYSIFMPNSGNKKGGVSRKIDDYLERKRLKGYIKNLNVQKGSSIIFRTIAQTKNYDSLKLDYEYLSKLWDSIRNNTFVSEAPSLVYQEGNIIARTIREFDIDNIVEILIDGAKAYKETLEFIKFLVPNYENKIKKYRAKIPIFSKYKVEEQINSFFCRKVSLESGGYIVIDVTEALVAIDVNSGKSTGERNIEKTALVTNLEAAKEIARQLKLRDLSGIIAIDFIDMGLSKNRREVENSLKAEILYDKAKIQINNISNFGVMEMSRQRIKPNFFESHYEICSYCEGLGHTKSSSSQAIQLLRHLENKIVKEKEDFVAAHIYAHISVIEFLFNYKRSSITSIEAFYNINIFFHLLQSASKYNEFDIQFKKNIDTDALAIHNSELNKFSNENYLSKHHKTKYSSELKPKKTFFGRLFKAITS